MYLCGGPDNGIRQLDALAAAQLNGLFGGLRINSEEFKTIQKCARRICRLRCRTHHDFHPGDDADKRISVPVQLQASGGKAQKIIDQDIGIYDGSHHSPRSFSWYARPSSGSAVEPSSQGKMAP